MTREQYSENLELAKNEFRMLFSDIYRKHKLTPAGAAHILMDVTSEVIKYSVDKEEQWFSPEKTS